jgi:hypothetical protein
VKIPVLVDADLIPKLALGHTDPYRVGLVVLGRFVDFPEFALDRAQVLIFSTTGVRSRLVPTYTIQEEGDRSYFS